MSVESPLDPSNEGGPSSNPPEEGGLTVDTLKPGEDDLHDAESKKSMNRWHNFESQYSIAQTQSVMVEREKWGSALEFLMSCIASAVGLGNIWRFPFICGQNGGGAFLFVYLIVVTIIARPIYMMELGLGQFTSSGPIKIWECCPAFRGVGYTAAIASFCLVTFYVCIMGWALVYFGYYSWGGGIGIGNNSKALFAWDRNGEHIPGPGFIFGVEHLAGGKKETLDFKQGKGLDGPPVKNVAIGLFVSWILVWAVMVGGVSGSGKIAYFTALFPYSVLIILLGAGLSLNGCGQGIEFFFKPKLSKILEANTWFQAVSQCFFSLGLTFGGIIMFSSFNQFNHKLGRDILIISIMDTITSILAGVCLFSLLGNLARNNWKGLVKNNETSKKTFTKVIDEETAITYYAEQDGAGMAFAVFPEVLVAFKDVPYLGNFFSIAFFFMIVVLAVGSANAIMGTIVTVVCDQFPHWKRKYVVTIMCIFCFLVGLLYTCPSGVEIVDLVDKHGTEVVIYILAMFEVIGIAWVYGIKNLCNDLEFMLGSKLNIYWMLCWAILPVLLFILFICYLVEYKRNKDWTDGTLASAWILSILSLSAIPIVGVIMIQTRKSRSFVKRLKASFYPSQRWGPKDPVVREAWRKFKKTRPSELRIYSWVMKHLRLRKRGVDYSVNPKPNYWETEEFKRPSIYPTNISPEAYDSVELETSSTMPSIVVTPEEENPSPAIL